MKKKTGIAFVIVCILLVLCMVPAYADVQYPDLYAKRTVCYVKGCPALNHIKTFTILTSGYDENRCAILTYSYESEIDYSEYFDVDLVKTSIPGETSVADAFDDDSGIIFRSSNTSIAAVSELYGDCTLTAKKPGKFTLSAKIKLTNGETRTMNLPLKVVKTAFPLSVLKLNGKSYLGKVKKDDTIIFKHRTPFKVKINVKAATGWKITNLSVKDTSQWTDKTIKNGSTVQMNINSSICITAKNKSTGCLWTCYLGGEYFYYDMGEDD